MNVPSKSDLILAGPNNPISKLNTLTTPVYTTADVIPAAYTIAPMAINNYGASIPSDFLLDGSFEESDNNSTVFKYWTSTGTVAKAIALISALTYTAAQLQASATLTQNLNSSSNFAQGSVCFSIYCMTTVSETNAQTINLTITHSAGISLGTLTRIDDAGVEVQTPIVPNDGRWYRFYLPAIITGGAPVSVTLTNTSSASSIGTYFDAGKFEYYSSGVQFKTPGSFIFVNNSTTQHIQHLVADDIVTGTLIVGGSSTTNPYIIVQDGSNATAITIGKPTGGYGGININSPTMGLLVGTSGAQRLEVLNSGIAGYDSSNTLQVQLQSSNGALVTGNGSHTLDSNGMTIKETGTTNLYTFYDALSSGRLISTDAVKYNLGFGTFKRNIFTYANSFYNTTGTILQAFKGTSVSNLASNGTGKAQILDNQVALAYTSNTDNCLISVQPGGATMYGTTVAIGIAGNAVTLRDSLAITGSTTISTTLGVTGATSLSTLNTTGAIGVGTASPIDSLSNTTTVISDSMGTSSTSVGITWRSSAAGYLLAFSNNSATTTSQGLLLKLQNAANANRIITLASGGLERFVVKGDGCISSGGTTFPTSPSTGDRYFRSDVDGGREFVWNGTYWLGDVEVLNTNNLSSVSATGTNLFEFSIPSDAYLVSSSMSYTTGITNSNTNYWKASLIPVAGGTSYLDVVTSASAVSVNDYALFTTGAATGAPKIPVLNKGYILQFNKTGTPSNLSNITVTLRYRLIQL